MLKEFKDFNRYLLRKNPACIFIILILVFYLGFFLGFACAPSRQAAESPVFSSP